MLRLKLRDVCFCAVLAMPALAVSAQTPSSQAADSSRILGTVTAAGSGSVTVHTATAGDVEVALTPETRLLRATPGEKTLKDAAPITAADLAIGDRVLIRTAAGGDAAHPSAAILVAMKQGDISQAHAQESADWQRNGVAGIAEMVDPVSGTITLKPHGGTAPVVIHTTAATSFRRYAPDSTAFADTHPSTLAEIRVGDQIRARGPKEASGVSIDAEAVVAGSFRDIAGTVLKTDPGANTLTLKDLATKKTLTLSLDASTQLRKLPAALAERLAHAKSGQTSREGRPGRPPQSAEAQGRPHADETADLLQQAPSIPLTDLKKGDAVMIVASGPSAAKATAITIVSGVEPLLEAPPDAAAGLFSASWNLGGGDAAEQGAPQK